MQTQDNLNDLVSEIRERRVVLWVGSGFSRYAGYPTGTKLAEIIKSHASDTEIKHLKQVHRLDEVAQEFVSLKGSRDELLEILRDTFKKDPISTEYHEMIALLPHFEQIITTNYDTLFERVYGTGINVIVTDEQIRRVVAGNKVNLFKIHGDIDQPDTILITADDYVDFFSDEKNGLLWNEIRSITSKYTILFIGYSLSDINVKYILKEIFSKLNVEDVKSYLIVPGLPEHTQNEWREKYGLKYIDLSAEEAVSLIREKVEENLIIDTYSGRLDLKSALKGLTARKIDAKFSAGRDGVKLSSVSSQIGGPPLTFDFGVRSLDPTNSVLAEKIHDLFSGELVEELTLSPEEVDLIFKPKIGNIPLFDSKSLEHITLTVQPHPLKEFNAELLLRNSGKRLFNVKVEHYMTPTKMHLKLIHPLFTVSIFAHKDDGEKNTFNLKLPGLEDIAQASEIYEFFYIWMTGDDILIFAESSDPIFTLPSSYIVDPTAESRRIIGIGHQLTSQINKIQTHFGIKLHIEVGEISESYEEALIDIVAAIDGKKRKVNDMTLKMNNKELVRDWCEQGVPNIRVTLNYFRAYNIFGRKFTIQEIQVEGENLIIQNLEEVTALVVKNANEIPVTLKSIDGRLKVWYKSVTMGD
ncbi:SIR2 family protein [Methanoculleus sp. 10]|uniref:SIR2 family protein n=1 Tax=Methanoculleus sp. 10 TaxID=430615 RepID=UPI0025F2509D|nr:SIR2 family protein [Methanoculleus sp. 10]